MKDIQGYEGKYAIDESGNVWSYKRKKFIKQQTDKSGYYQVALCKNGKQKRIAVHRLVAETFLPKEDNKPHVNHKDENRKNNAVYNLEWCTHAYNCNYGTRNIKISKSNKGKPKSELHKAHISEARKGMIFTEEHKKHISESRKRERIYD